MNIKTLILAGSMTIAGITALETMLAQEIPPTQEEQATPFESYRNLDETKVNQLMNLQSADEILQPLYTAAILRKLTLEGHAINFREQVYQENILREEKKPSVVLFYDGSDQQAAVIKRTSILLAAVAIKYQQQGILFFTVDVSTDDSYRTNESGEYTSEEALREHIKSIPCIAIYSIFDLVRGETREINDGIVKQIDILNGGPKSSRVVPSWAYGSQSASDWIETNLLAQQHPRRVIRLNNSAKPVEILLSE